MTESSDGREPFDHLLGPRDEECAGIRTLMVSESEGHLEEGQLREIEAHVAGCTACQTVLAGEDPQVAGPGPGLMEMPTAEEWARLESGIEDATGLSFSARTHWRREESRSQETVPKARPAAADIVRLDSARARRAEPFSWQIASFPAAALLLCAILLISLLGPRSDDYGGFDEGTELAELQVDVEILDLPEGSEAMVWTVDDGVMVFITSS